MDAQANLLQISGALITTRSLTAAYTAGNNNTLNTLMIAITTISSIKVNLDLTSEHLHKIWVKRGGVATLGRCDFAVVVLVSEPGVPFMRT